MKRLTLLTLVFLILVGYAPRSARAQSGTEAITLNDASPSIDVVITLPQDTTGTITLEYSGAAVKLTDSQNNIVFKASDARLHGMELNIAPNSGTHTLIVERLPGVVVATVRVTSRAELTPYGTSQLVTGLAIAPRQEVSVPVTSDHPGDTISVSVPGQSAGMFTATFPGIQATTQFVDESGVVLSESTAGHVDGLSLLIDPGNYRFTLLGNGVTDRKVASARLVTAEDAGITVMQAPKATPAATTNVVAQCTAIITTGSVNLRSGPGTGYTVLGYGYRDQVFTVGGRNAENNWLVVAGNGTASAWVSRDTVQLKGACNTLTAFNIPLKNAQPAALVITTPKQSGGTGGSGDNHEEHEEHDDD